MLKWLYVATTPEIKILISFAVPHPSACRSRISMPSATHPLPLYNTSVRWRRQYERQKICSVVICSSSPHACSQREWQRISRYDDPHWSPGQTTVASQPCTTQLIGRRSVRRPVDKTSATVHVRRISTTCTERERATRQKQGARLPYHAASAESSVPRVYGRVVLARAGRRDLITISWAKKERLNKNITCFGDADPVGVGTSGVPRPSVCPRRFRGSEVEWNGPATDSLPLGRRGEQRRLIAHLPWAGRGAEPVPSPAADWSRARASGVKRKENNYNRPSVLDTCSIAIGSFTADFMNTGCRFVGL